MTIIYLGPDGGDPAAIRRVEGFRGEGVSVFPFSFFRGRGRPSHVSLGAATDGHIGRRIIGVLRAIFILSRRSDELARTSVIYARNLDLLLVALAIKFMPYVSASIKVYYEVLDIHPVLVGKGILTRAFRLVERFGLRKIDGLVVSSPGFIMEYFEPIQGFKGRYFVMENKLDINVATVARLPRAAICSDKVVIGYFGKFRCRKSLQLLEALAAKYPSLIRIKMAGIVPKDFLREFESLLSLENVDFLGEYRYPEDLVEMYRDVHLNWAIDLSDGFNSRVLIPNRLYEGGAFGVMPLTIVGTQTMMWAERFGCSIPISDPLDESLEALCAPEFWNRWRQAQSVLEKLPLSHFLVTDDYKRLVEFLSGSCGN